MLGLQLNSPGPLAHELGLHPLSPDVGLESEDFASLHELSNGMGLFLQKTNIIRDYLVSRGWTGGAQAPGLRPVEAGPGEGLEGPQPHGVRIVPLDPSPPPPSLFLPFPPFPQEDIMEEPAPRMFWPKEIWGKHGDSLEDFKDPENAEAAVACLNDMVQ